MITLTANAAQKVKGILEQEKESLPQGGLRIYVQGGGCSGFQYGMVLDDRAGAAERVDRRPAVVVLLVPGLEENDADRAARLQRVFHHLAVARLEDVQRQRRPGEQDDVRQREEGDEAAQC